MRRDCRKAQQDDKPSHRLFAVHLRLLTRPPRDSSSDSPTPRTDGPSSPQFGPPVTPVPTSAAYRTTLALLNRRAILPRSSRPQQTPLTLHSRRNLLNIGRRRASGVHSEGYQCIAPPSCCWCICSNGPPSPRFLSMVNTESPFDPTLAYRDTSLRASCNHDYRLYLRAYGYTKNRPGTSRRQSETSIPPLTNYSFSILPSRARAALTSRSCRLATGPGHRCA